MGTRLTAYQCHCAPLWIKDGGEAAYKVLHAAFASSLLIYSMTALLTPAGETSGQQDKNHQDMIFHHLPTLYLRSVTMTSLCNKAYGSAVLEYIQPWINVGSNHIWLLIAINYLHNDSDWSPSRWDMVSWQERCLLGWKCHYLQGGSDCSAV